MSQKIDYVFRFVIVWLLLLMIVWMTISLMGYTKQDSPADKPTVLILDQRTDKTLYNTPIYIVEYMDTATMEYRYADFRSELKMTQFLEYLDKIAIIEWLGVE